MNKLRLTLLIALAFAGQVRAADQMTLAPGFVYEDIYKGNGMISIDFDPTGAMYVTEKQGRVLLFEPKGKDFKDPVVILDIRSLVNPDNESGLLGIAIDPDFNTNHYVYVFYTTTPDQQLARYTLSPDRTALTDGVVLIKGFPKTHTNHKAGDIHFRPGEPNNLYIVLGNDADPNNSLVDNLQVWNGKLLRVNKADGKGLPDNPFYDGNPDSIASRVWALGLRNPFRFTFAPSGFPDNALYISENGDGTDLFFQLEKGGNGGWSQGGDRGMDNPKDPKVHILGLHSPSMTGIAIAEKGPFAGPNGEPVLYEAHWYAPEEILRGVLGGPMRNTFTPLPNDPKGMFAVHLKCVNMKFGPDGNLYLNDSSFGSSTGNGFRLGRVKPVANDSGDAPTAPIPPPSAPPVTPAAQVTNPPVSTTSPAVPPAPPAAPPVPAHYFLKAPVAVTTSYGVMTIPANTEVRVLRQTGDTWHVTGGGAEFDVQAAQISSSPQ